MVFVFPFDQPGWLFAWISARFDAPPGSPSELAAWTVVMALATLPPLTANSLLMAWPYAFQVLVSPPWHRLHEALVRERDVG
jgi:hypothetical protein